MVNKTHDTQEKIFRIMTSSLHQCKKYYNSSSCELLRLTSESSTIAKHHLQ